MGQMFEWANSKTWMWGWVVTELVSPGLYQDCPPSGKGQGQGQLSLTHTMGVQLSGVRDEGWVQFTCMWDLFSICGSQWWGQFS